MKEAEWPAKENFKPFPEGEEQKVSLFKMIVQEAKITLLRFFETRKFTVNLRVLATVLKIFKANIYFYFKRI